MKRLYLYFFILCAIGKVQAQSSNYADRMNHIFGNIDKSKVTTGYLKEFGIRLNSVEAYNGALSDTNWVDVTQWQSLYSSLYSMRVGTVASSMASPSTAFANLKTQQDSSPGVVLLAALYYPYQQYKSNAYTNGDVTVSNDQIYDVSGRNPYDTKTTFAVAPMEYHLKGNAFDFKLQSNMIYTSTGLTLSTVEIDFGNGQGYQAVSLNTAKNISYTSGGEKELKIKFVYSGGSTLYSHAKLYVDYVSSQAEARFNGSGTSTQSITGAAYSGASATGEVTIETAGNDGILDKPLIVVEGFDPDGSFNYNDLVVRNTQEPGSLNIPLGTGLTLNEAIENEGYDLVFVNYQNGTDYIQRNAYMVEAVIEWVNSHKTGSEKNVVLGMSMGGMVARYALRHMEQTSRTHDTKLYISHDAPHQGANVPLAYQAFVRHLGGESISWPIFSSLFTIDIVDIVDLVPQLNDGLELLQSPAAQQMLIYQLSGTGSGTSNTTNSLHSSFVSEYTSMGYPVQGGIRSIAISNGSECGTPLGFSANANLININKTVDLPYFLSNLALAIVNGLSVNPIRVITSFLSTNTDVKAEFNLKALPNQQSQQIYKGKIYIKKKILFIINVEEQLIGEKTLNATSSMLAVDNAAGGVYDIEKFVSLPDALDDYVLETQFNFIPTYSSLDLGSGTQTIVATDLTRTYSMVAPPNTPFQNFFTNPAISENHIQFTLHNGNWLLAELEGSPVTSSCNQLCAGTDIMPTLTGPSLVCTSEGTFTLSNAPSGSTVTWAATPSSLFASGYQSGTGTSAFVKAASSSTSGSGTITFTIASSCGSAVAIQKTIWVGKPGIPVIDPDKVMMDVPPKRFTVSIDPPSGQEITSYNWYLDNVTNSSHTGTAIFNRTSPYCGHTYFVEIEAVNTCYPSTRGNISVDEPSCSSSLTLAISPNPGSDEVNIEQVSSLEGSSSETAETTSANNQLEGDLMIMNQDGQLMYSEKAFKNSSKINVRNLKPGIYIVKYATASYVAEGKFIKQ